MTLQTVHTAAGFSRCAVCKIDLKGRFVYVDEEVEKLLGFSKDELFGKPLLDFLDDPSRELVSELLVHRNHYEAFYDTARITLVDRNGHKTAAALIASLNFIAGNPVNFQLIITRDQAAGRPSAGESDNLWDREFVERLLAIENPEDWKAYLNLLREFTGAEMACVYRIGAGTLEPRSAVGDDSSAEFAFASIPEPTSLHQRVAETGCEYSLTDQRAVQEAVEKDGSAPDEFIFRISPAEDRPCLVRLIFRAGIDAGQATTSVGRARLGLGLVAKVMRLGHGAGDHEDAAPDVKFTIGFLDSLGVGAMMTQADGQIVGYNATLARLLEQNELAGNYLDFAALLAQSNDPAVEGTIENYFRTTSQEESFDDLRLDLRLPGGDVGRLVIVRFSCDADDMSSGFVLIPESAVPRTSPTPASDENRLWSSIVSSLQTELNKATGQVEKLGNRYYNELDEGGNACLEGFCQSVQHLNGMFDELAVMLRLLGGRKKEALIDFNLLLRKVADDIRVQFPATEIDCGPGDLQLPKVMTDPVRAEKIIRNLLSREARGSSAGKIRIGVEPDSGESFCRIVISGGGAPVSQKHAGKVFEFFSSAAGTGQSRVTGDGSSLAVTRQLACSLGWEIDLTLGPDDFGQVMLSLPLQR